MDLKDLLDLNPLLTDKVRLALMATLATSDEPMDFSSLLESLELTKGNLSSHMRKLEDGGLVKVQKEFLDRKPRTTYACSAKGRREMKKYLKKLEALIQLSQD